MVLLWNYGQYTIHINIAAHVKTVNLKQLIKPPPGSHQIERISQTKNRTGLLVWATHQQTIYKSILINIRLYQSNNIIISY